MSGRALVFAPIGPNPASVTEAVWALDRHHGVVVDEVHVVTLARGAYWVEQELRGPDGALADLAAALGRDTPLVEHVVRRPDGTPVDDDGRDDDAACYRRAAWDAARACLAQAGARPVVFLLGGGRLRTTTAYATTAFQLLARANDALFDVRVDDRRVEGGTGFFFPEQAQQYLVVDGGVVDARQVAVRLVPVEVPRLAGLVEAAQLGSFESALAASTAAVDAATPPELVVDLAEGRVAAGGEVIPLSPAQLAWYAALALTRVAGGKPGDGPPGSIRSARSRDVAAACLAPMATRAWVKEIQDFVLRQALGLPSKRDKPLLVDETDERLPKLRSDTRRAVRAWVAARGRPGWEAWLVPEQARVDGVTYQRLALPPERIRIVGR